MNISIIGYGNLAKAVAQGLLRHPNYLLRVSSPTLVEGNPHPRLQTYSSNLSILPNADILILAVKPAQMAMVLAEIHTHLPSHLIVVSVAAGLTLDWFSSRLPLNTPLVRAMPNLASQCGEGATPLLANKVVTAEQHQCATELFDQCGLTTWVQQEKDLDAFTALSGSGLAYFLLFAEAMGDAAIKLGLEADVAMPFAVQTLLGAAHLASLSNHTLSELRAQITSKGGTTAAALALFAENHLSDIVLAAMTAAFERSQSSLSKE